MARVQYKLSSKLEMLLINTDNDFTLIEGRNRMQNMNLRTQTERWMEQWMDGCNE